MYGLIFLTNNLSLCILALFRTQTSWKWKNPNIWFQKPIFHGTHLWYKDTFSHFLIFVFGALFQGSVCYIFTHMYYLPTFALSLSYNLLFWCRVFFFFIFSHPFTCCCTLLYIVCRVDHHSNGVQFYCSWLFYFTPTLCAKSSHSVTIAWALPDLA